MGFWDNNSGGQSGNFWTNNTPAPQPIQKKGGFGSQLEQALLAFSHGFGHQSPQQPIQAPPAMLQRPASAHVPNANLVGMSRGYLNTIGGLAAPIVTGLGEAASHDVIAPIMATGQSIGNMATGHKADWKKNYNHATDAYTNQVYNDVQGIDNKLGTSINQQMTDAYAHPGKTAAFSTLAAIGGGLGDMGKAGTVIGRGMGLGFGGYQLAQTPQLVKEYNAAKTPEEKSRILTEGVLNTGMGVLGAAHGAPLAKDGVVAAGKGIKYVANDPVLRNQNGFIAGSGAKDFAKNQAKGKTFIDPADNLPKFEVSDHKASVRNSGLKELNNKGETTLGNLINHKELFKQYGKGNDTFDARTVRVTADSNLPPSRHGQYDPATNTITLNPELLRTKDDILNSLVHENQHGVDVHEGVFGGTNPEQAGGFDNYLKDIGEQRARDQAARRTMTPQERMANPSIAQAGPDPLQALGYLQRDKVAQAVKDTGALTASHPSVGVEKPSSIMAYEGQPRDGVGKFSNGKQEAAKSPLHQEALKYKTAKEFTQAQLDKYGFTNDKPIKTYRGEGESIHNSTLVHGKYMADSPEFAANFGKVSEHQVPAGSKIFDLDKVKNGSSPVVADATLVEPDRMTNYLIDHGFTHTRNTNTRGVEYVELKRGVKSAAKERDAAIYKNYDKRFGALADKFKTESSFIKAAEKANDGAWEATGYAPDKYQAVNESLLKDYFKSKKRGITPGQRLDDSDTTLTKIFNEAHSKGDTPGIMANETRPTLPEVPKKQEVKPPAKIAKNKFTESVQNSPEVSTEVQGQVSGQHEVRNTKDLVTSVNKEIDSQGLDAAHQDVLEKLSVQSGTTDDATLAKAIELAKRFDELGDVASQDKAASLYDQVSEHAVGKGQGSQILSILARRSPAGLRNKAFRDLKKAGVELTPELKQEIQGHIDVIKSMKDGPGRDMAIAVLQKTIAKHLPQSAMDNALSVWKAGLLSGVKTQGGNFLSNATFGVIKKVSDLPSAIADMGLSLITNKRTKTSTLRGSSGIVEGIKKGAHTLRTGIDERNIGADKYEQHGEINFKNKYVQAVFGKTSNLVFRGMSAADQPFYYPAFKNSLYDQAFARLKTSGYTVLEQQRLVGKVVANADEAMVVQAAKDAQKAVLGYDTMASKVIQGAHKTIENSGMSSVAKKTANTVLNVLAPFVKVPSAFLSRTVDFTPLGFGREVVEQIAAKRFDQRAFATAIGEGATGTGIVAIGMMLAHNKMLSGDFPSGDQKEQARWKTEKIIPNAVKIGDRWISLNYLGSLGMLLGAGKHMVDAGDGGADWSGQLASAVTGMGQGLLNQSFVQGMSGFSDAIKNPEQNGMKWANSMAGSTIPAWLNDIGNISDEYQRQSNGVVDAIKARLPIARQTLNVKKDSFGNALKQADGGLNAAINPFKPSKSNNNPITNEIDRLKTTSKDNFVIPTPDKTIDVGGQTIRLTPQQQDQYNSAIGQQVQDLWGQIIKTSDYKDLSDNNKANTLRNAMQDIQAVEKQKMLANMGQTALSENIKLTQQQKYLASGDITPEDYVYQAVKSAQAKELRDAGISTAGGNKRIGSAYKKVSTKKVAKGRKIAVKKVAFKKPPAIKKAPALKKAKVSQVKAHSLAPNTKLMAALLKTKA